MSVRGVLVSAAALTALGYATVVGLTWAFQRKLIYFPARERVPSATRFFAGGEDVVFETEDQTKLAGWFVPASAASEAGRAGATVLVFNGNGGHRAYRAPLAAALSNRGISVLLFDYRGYGENPGVPTEAGLMADGRAARTYLVRRPDVDPERIVYFGESLGCAVAIGLALDHPPAAMILRSPFWSLAEVGRLHYWFLPIGTLLKDRYPSNERIGRVTCPLLVVAGDGDRLIPAAQSRRLYLAAPGPKRFVLVPGADHNDEALLAGPQLVDAVVSFLDEGPKRRIR